MWEVYTNFTLHAVNIFLFFCCYQKARTPIKIIGFSVVVTCIVEIYAAKLKFEKTNNLFLYHGFAVLHYIAYSYFYYIVLHNKTVKKVILITLPTFIFFSFISAIYLQPLEEYNSYTLVTKHFLISVWIMIYFLEFFITPGYLKIQHEPYFWISTGLLFFSVGNFFIEGMMDYLINKSMKIALSFYLTGVVFSYFFYATIAVSFILVLYNTKK